MLRLILVALLSALSIGCATIVTAQPPPVYDNWIAVDMETTEDPAYSYVDDTLFTNRYLLRAQVDHTGADYGLRAYAYFFSEDTQQWVSMAGQPGNTAYTNVPIGPGTSLFTYEIYHEWLQGEIIGEGGDTFIKVELRSNTNALILTAYGHAALPQ